MCVSLWSDSHAFVSSFFGANVHYIQLKHTVTFFVYSIVNNSRHKWSVSVCLSLLYLCISAEHKIQESRKVERNVAVS